MDIRDCKINLTDEEEIEVLKWNRKGIEKFSKAIEAGCSVETRNYKHYLIGKSTGVKIAQLSDRMYKELIDKKAIEVIK